MKFQCGVRDKSGSEIIINTAQGRIRLLPRKPPLDGVQMEFDKNRPTFADSMRGGSR